MSQVDKKNKLIPNDWASTKLDCVVNIVRGVTYKKDQASDFFVAGYLPVIRANNIQNDKLILSDFVYVDANIIKCTQKIKKNDIVVAMSSGSKSVVGKTAKAESDLDAAFGAFCGLLRPSSLIIPDMIGFYTRSAYYRSKVSELSAGANINNLKPAHFCELDFPLPPLAEQKEIADQLDTLLAQVEATQARLARIPDIIKRFRQSVLSAAVSGKLTEEWRAKNNNLDIKSYINDIEKCRKQAHEKENERLRVNRNYKPPVIGETPSNIILPVGWALLSVDQIAAKITDGVHKKPNYISSGIPFVTVKNMTKGKGISFDNLNYISLEDHQEYCKRTNPKKGDILISKDGTLGVIRKVDVDFEFSIFVSVALVKPASYAMSDYLEIVFQSPFVQKQMVGVGTGLQHIHLTDLRKDMLPIPPSEEQAEIVRRVEQLFVYADTLEQQAKAAKARVDNLTQAILAKAFRGELTADWRAANPDLISGDNSAAALLARIQAERAANGGKKKKRTLKQ
ncbi:restriction endonuclease subunit S [Aeromonas veronii]|nr:restriction endonuclease subunit S [Aeromonas veronii]